MNPYLIIASLGVWAASSFGAFMYGEHVSNLGCEVQQAKSVQASQKQKDNEAAQIQTAATNEVKQDAQDHVVYRTVTAYVDRVVEKPVYRDGSVCLDDDGVRAANAAIAGSAANLTEPVAAVPGSPAAQ